MTKTIIDYDSFRKEVTQEPIGFTIGGETYDMAASLPATIAIQVLALQSADSESDVPLELLETVGTACFGRETWLKILAVNKVSVDELGDLVQAMISAYVPTEDDPEDPTPAST